MPCLGRNHENTHICPQRTTVMTVRILACGRMLNIVNSSLKLLLQICPKTAQNITFTVETKNLLVCVQKAYPCQFPFVNLVPITAHCIRTRSCIRRNIQESNKDMLVSQVVEG
jgi:hypothetical protein